jgi:hypothetical protein
VSQKKKKVVPSAETEKQENAEKIEDLAKTESSSVDTNAVAPQQAAPASPQPTFVSIERVLTKVDAGMVEKAEALGIPQGLIPDLLLWMKGVDAKFNIVGEALQKVPTAKSIADEMMKQARVERDQAIAAREGQQGEGGQQQRGGKGDSELIAIVDKVLGEGGGASNPVQEKINQLTLKFLDNAIDNMSKPSKFEQFFEEELAKAKAKTMAKALTEG